MRFLYRFGFCTPVQWQASEAYGWDDEASSAFFVVASSKDEALEWGRYVSEAFFKILFENEGWGEDVPSWRKSGFASWIEDDPELLFTQEELENLAAVNIGEMPDFEKI